jgi:hypothetical protein
MSIFHRSEDTPEREADGLAPEGDDARARADQPVEGTSDEGIADNHPDDAAAPAATAYSGRAPEVGLDRQTVVQRERERYGGVRVGAAFFGWLTAMGTAVLLTALLAAAGTAVGVASTTEAGQAVGQAASNVATVGLAGGIALLVILFVAYYCGGYVAGRMARFNGATQGAAVWVVAVVIAVGVAVLGATAGSKYNILGTLNGFPRIPVEEGSLTRGGVVALLLAAIVTLVAAILGGVAGMRYHRNVDRVGLGS